MSRAALTIDDLLAKPAPKPAVDTGGVVNDDGGILRTRPTGDVVRRDWTPQKPAPRIDRASSKTFD